MTEENNIVLPFYYDLDEMLSHNDMEKVLGIINQRMSRQQKRYMIIQILDDLIGDY